MGCFVQQERFFFSKENGLSGFCNYISDIGCPVDNQVQTKLYHQKKKNLKKIIPSMKAEKIGPENKLCMPCLMLGITQLKFLKNGFIIVGQ